MAAIATRLLKSSAHGQEAYARALRERRRRRARSVLVQFRRIGRSDIPVAATEELGTTVAAVCGGKVLSSYAVEKYYRDFNRWSAAQAYRSVHIREMFRRDGSRSRSMARLHSAMLKLFAARLREAGARWRRFLAGVATCTSGSLSPPSRTAETTTCLALIRTCRGRSNLEGEPDAASDPAKRLLVSGVPKAWSEAWRKSESPIGKSLKRSRRPSIRTGSGAFGAVRVRSVDAWSSPSWRPHRCSPQGQLLLASQALSQ